MPSVTYQLVDGETVLKEKSGFKEILDESIFDGLSRICSSIPEMVLFYLEKSGAIKSKSSIDDPMGFSAGLEKVFGFGAKVIERMILVDL